MWCKHFIDKLNTIIKDESVYQSLNDFVLVNPYSKRLTKDKKYKENAVNGIYKKYYNDINIRSITNYDSFYPESFFDYWEVLQNINFGLGSKIGFLDDKNQLGHLEATIKWLETYTVYEENEYIRIPLFKPKKQKIETVYCYEQHNCKFGDFTDKELHKISNKYKDNPFDTIICDISKDMLNLTGMIFLKQRGNMIIKLDYFWNVADKLFSCLKSCFNNVYYIKPECSHILDTNLYIVCEELVNTFDSISDIVSNNISSHKIVYMIDEHILNVMQSLKVDDDANLLSDVDLYTDYYINNAIEWANKNDLSVKDCFLNQKHDNNSKYLKFILPKTNYEKYNIKLRDTIIDEHLHNNKRRLNIAKRIIDTKEQSVDIDIDNNIIDWNRLTDCIDIYRNLKKQVSWNYNTNMVTNAWLKMYEILYNSELIDGLNTLNSFHLCEAPGAFILSINHFLKTKNIRYNWYAQTLNPYTKKNKNKGKSMLKDEFNLISEYDYRWIFGENETGDITDKRVILSYANDSLLNNLDLITGDAGLKMPSNMFNEQESFVSKVNYGQVLTMLNCLPIDKHCIFKTFIPLSEPFTISLIDFICSVFEEVSVHKPLTSHPSSSEVYFVCKWFKGIDERVKEHLFDVLDNFDNRLCLFSSDVIEEKFLKKLRKCSDIFVDSQINSINRSLYYRDIYYHDYSVQDNITKKRKKNINKWLKTYNIQSINDRDKLI